MPTASTPTPMPSSTPASGEPAEALSVSLPLVPDAATIGRPHSWNELHTTAAAMIRSGAKEGHRLVEALRQHD